MFLTMFAVMLAAVVGHTDCHLSNSERTTKQISIDINPMQSKGTSCTEPYKTEFCLNGGRCFSIIMMDTFSYPYCECANGFMGERCERKYLDNSYNLRNYIEADENDTPQNQSDVANAIVIEIHVGSGAVNRVSVTVNLLLAMLLLHHLIAAI